jgi:glyoxylase-like metal-dependent hydrolase (beta-lactamase superfamily II)
LNSAPATYKIHLLNNRFVNLVLIVEPDGLTLIDTGLARSGPKLVMSKLAELGFQPNDLKRILITHADPDHTGGAPVLRAGTGAKLCASAIEKAAIERGTTSRQPTGVGFKIFANTLGKLMMPLAPATVDEELSDGQVLPILGGLRVLATPGHTPGHLSFFAPALGVLIAGDSMNATSGSLQFKPAPVHWNFAEGCNSVRKQAQLGAHTVYCGHGPVIENAAFPNL